MNASPITTLTYNLTLMLKVCNALGTMDGIDDMTYMYEYVKVKPVCQFSFQIQDTHTHTLTSH